MNEVIGTAEYSYNPAENAVDKASENVVIDPTEDLDNPLPTVGGNDDTLVIILHEPLFILQIISSS